jgi:hypothetical protein
LFLPIAKADVGVGIRWKTEELFLNEFEEGCVNYEIYNPFDTNVTAKLNTGREIENMVSKVEPEQFFIPGYKGEPNDNKAKLANKQDITICFKPSFFRWPPFYPVEYKGVVLATALPIGIPGMGSASASVVQAPLTLRVGSMGTFYIFVVILIITIAVVVFLILKIKKKLPKAKKKYCRKCKKYFSFKLKFCPACGSRLIERKI